MPAEFDDEVVSYVDLALDLWVSVDGKQTVLDEDEFEELNLTDTLRADALQGLHELKLLFESKNPPLY
jgi:protein associated with RNAse G/E